jgi:hypothetical protein
MKIAVTSAQVFAKSIRAYNARGCRKEPNERVTFHAMAAIVTAAVYKVMQVPQLMCITGVGWGLGLRSTSSAAAEAAETRGKEAVSTSLKVTF